MGLLGAGYGITLLSGAPEKNGISIANSSSASRNSNRPDAGKVYSAGKKEKALIISFC